MDKMELNEETKARLTKMCEDLFAEKNDAIRISLTKKYGKEAVSGAALVGAIGSLIGSIKEADGIPLDELRERFAKVFAGTTRRV